ncbi:MAG: AIR synthase related protein, partial [Longimicrobiales bacterium]
SKDLSGLDHSAVEHDATDVLRRLLATPTIASKRWVYNQYDTTVRTNTVVGPGGDAGVLRIRGTRMGVAATVDCNGRYVYLNPRRGAQIAVAEAARNIVCVGARPRAITNNLNFGNPLKPEVYFQLREAVAGIGEACTAFETPVTGGNVSLYNENPLGAIYPTPVIGMVGVLTDVEKYVPSAFCATGDSIILLGRNTDELGGSEYLKLLHELVAGDAPAVDLNGERALQEAVIAMADARLIRSAHDCAEGGLGVTIAESAFGDQGPFGVDVALADNIAAAPLLFGEAQGRIVVSCGTADEEAVLSIAEKNGVPATVIGKVGAQGGAFRITTHGATINARAAELAETYNTAIPRLMDTTPIEG